MDEKELLKNVCNDISETGSYPNRKLVKATIAALEEEGLLSQADWTVPEIDELQEYSYDGICPTPCGCEVEPDGTCCHGASSWLLLCGVL